MKNLKRTLGLLLALLLLLSTFAVGFVGCGASDEEEPETTDTPTEEETTEAPETDPVRTEMNSKDLLKYAKERTVMIEVECEGKNGSYKGSGSGFFIDSKGTIVTSYHVIDGAKKITVRLQNHGEHDVEEIVDFNELYDIAVIKIDLDDTPYFEISEFEAEEGDTVYAVGAPNGVEGISTSGMVSNASEKVGMIDCIVSGAVISPGNSGGPLINSYGEAIGINAFTYTEIEGLSLAVNLEQLDKLDMNKHYSVSRYQDWYVKTVQRSYKLFNYQSGKQGYIYSKINTYQEVVGVACKCSTDDFDDFFYLPNLSNGYKEENFFYRYDYKSSQMDEYTDYLYSLGFELDKTQIETDWTAYVYYNSFTGEGIDIYVVDNSYLIIEPYAYFDR